MATWMLDPSVVHLNHGSFGACPIEVLEQQASLRSMLESNPVAFMLRQYQPLLERSRSALAGLVGADADGLVFVPNATHGVNAVLRTLEARLGSGDEVVVTSHTYNAVRNAVEVTAARVGARVVVADVPFPLASPADAVAAVVAATGPRTALLVIDHVTSPTALVLPVDEIVEALDPGVIVLVDGAHGPGMVDVDLASLGVDFYTGNCHKWLCGPKGAAFLWVAEEFRATAVAAVISHGHNDGWPASGSRFHAQFDWVGTDDPTPRLCVADAIETMAGHRPGGWSELRATNRALALGGRSVVLEALGEREPAPDAMIGSMASVIVPDETGTSPGIFDSLTACLQENWAIEVPVFTWPAAPRRLLRLSAQQYNGPRDYERLAEALRDVFAGAGGPQ